MTARPPIPGTSAVSDALDGLGAGGGVVEGVVPLAVAAGAVAGPVHLGRVRSSTEEGIPGLAPYLDAAPQGSFVVLAWDTEERASSFGGLAARRAVHLGCVGLLAGGWVRDAVEITAVGLRAWARGTTPRSGKGRLRVDAAAGPLPVGGVAVRLGDLIVADATGVCVVPRAAMEQVLAEARRLEGLDEQFARRLDEGWSFGDSARETGTL